MFDLINLLEEHRELMRERGYEEIGLGTYKEPDILAPQPIEERDKGIFADHSVRDDQPGIYMHQLEKAFSHHIREAQFKKQVHKFDVQGIGFFNDDKNVVDFLFRYEIDPKQGKIDLKSFTATMDGVTKKIILEQGMYNLPPADTVLSILSLGKEPKNETPDVSQVQQGATDNVHHIQKLLTGHHALLVDKGYSNKEHFPYRENFLFKKLEYKLQSKYDSENSTSDFLIRFQGFFNNQDDEVKYTFLYSVDKDNHALQLNALVADLNDKRIHYPVQEGNDLPQADHVWKHLTQSLKEEGTEVIYPKDKIKVLLKEQERFLGSFGYYKTLFDNNTNFIDRELQDVLLKSLNENGKLMIPINRNVHLNMNDRIECRFQYSFNPLKVELQLDSVVTKVGIAECTYSKSEIENQNLALPAIFNKLNEQNRLLQARKISDGPPDRPGMRAMVKHIQKRSF